MVKCGSCGKVVPEEQMKKGLTQLEHLKFMPFLLEKIAMKCNRCGMWICYECVTNKSAETMGGPIQHTNCGGVFERL